MQAGDVPGFKVRGQWRGRRAGMDARIEDRVKGTLTSEDGGEL